MGCAGGCRRFAAAALMHLNLMLAVLCGAAVVGSARLAWDPAAWAPLRALAPAEARVAFWALPAHAAAAALLAHAALLALHLRSAAARRALLLAYAISMTVLWCAELGALGWAARRAAAWARGGGAARAAAALRDLDAALRPLLRLLARRRLLPDRAEDLLDEVIADVPRNVYFVGALTLLVLVLQPAAAAAALLARPPAPRPPRSAPAYYDSVTSPLVPIQSNKRRRPKASYRGGRLVLV